MAKVFTEITVNRALNLYLQHHIKTIGINRKIGSDDSVDARTIDRIPIGDILNGEYKFIQAVDEKVLYEGLMKKWDRALYNRMYGIREVKAEDDMDIANETVQKATSTKDTKDTKDREVDLKESYMDSVLDELINEAKNNNDTKEKEKDTAGKDNDTKEKEKDTAGKGKKLSPDLEEVVKAIKETESKRTNKRCWLSDKDRENIKYLYVHGLRYADISAMTGISYATIYRVCNS